MCSKIPLLLLSMIIPIDLFQLMFLGVPRPKCGRVALSAASPRRKHMCRFAPLSLGEGPGVRAPGFPLLSLTRWRIAG